MGIGATREQIDRAFTNRRDNFERRLFKRAYQPLKSSRMVESAINKQSNTPPVIEWKGAALINKNVNKNRPPKNNTRFITHQERACQRT